MPVPPEPELLDPNPGQGPVAQMVEALRPLLTEVLALQRAENQQAYLELVGQLKPGKNVRVLPSDTVRFETTQVQTVGAAILASESLSRTLLRIEVDTDDTIYLTADPGAQAAASNTIAVAGPATVELPVRGVVYAVAETPTEVRLTVFSADY